MEYKVGDQVRLKTGCKAIIKFVGSSKFGSGLFYGIQHKDSNLNEFISKSDIEGRLLYPLNNIKIKLNEDSEDDIFDQMVPINIDSIANSKKKRNKKTNFKEKVRSRSLPTIAMHNLRIYTKLPATLNENKTVEDINYIVNSDSGSDKSSTPTLPISQIVTVKKKNNNSNDAKEAGFYSLPNALNDEKEDNIKPINYERLFAEIANLHTPKHKQPLQRRNSDGYLLMKGKIKKRNKNNNNIDIKPIKSKIKKKRKSSGVIVGHRYILNDNRFGICKYYGYLKHNNNTNNNNNNNSNNNSNNDIKKRRKYVGILLESGIGDCNGTLNGIEYFKCDANMGVFVEEKMIKQHLGKVVKS